MERNDLVERYLERCVSEWGYRSVDKARFHIENFLHGIDFRDTAVLDVGCGIGVMALYAACAGATTVVGLEPESAGSRGGTLREFRRMADSLELAGVTGLPETFQEYDPGDRKFDRVLMHASINHLDEPACIDLHTTREAQETYERIFRKLHDMMRPGAQVVIRDCSRYNFFAALGLRNPLGPTIEWEKHQPPEIWAAQLERCGFGDARIDWPLMSTKLRGLGAVFGTMLAAYFIRSSFRLVMTRT